MKKSFLVVDDEILVLKNLQRTLGEAVSNCEIRCFSSSHEAITEITQNDYIPDVALLDIEMPGLNGLELAKRIRQYAPTTKIIFTTGYEHFAVDAFKIHANGYLLKPITKERIQEELSFMNLLAPKRVCIQCFGNFDIFVDGNRVTFARSKAKELLAYLVHKQGSECTIKELSAVLFEDRSYDIRTQNYMQKIISVLVKTFQAFGLSDVIIKNYNSISIDRAQVECDYYNFLSENHPSTPQYLGEYMAQYSWAEYTIGYLDKLAERKRERFKFCVNRKN